MSDIKQSISLVGSGLNSDDSLEAMPVGDSPTTYASPGRQNVIVPPDNFGKLEDAWGTALVAATDRGLGTTYMGHVVDTDGIWCYYFLTGPGGSLSNHSVIGVNLRDATSVRVVMEDELELELDTDIKFKRAAYIDGWIYWASGQYGPKKIHVERAMNFTTYKDSAWDSAASYDDGDKVLYTDGGIYECQTDSTSGTPPPLDTANWVLDSYAYPNTAISGSASLLDGAFDLVELPPISPITGEYGDDTSRLYNNLRGKMFQFTYRWKYRNGGYSNTAPFSALFLPPDVESYNGEILNSFATNNVLTLYLDGGLEPLVEYVELFVRTGRELSWQYVDKLDAGATTYAFYNDYIMEVASDDMVNKLDNYIPKETRALELLSENVLVLGGNTYGFNNVTPDVALTSGWEVRTLNAPGADVASLIIGGEVITYPPDSIKERHWAKVELGSLGSITTGNFLYINLYWTSGTIGISYYLTASDVVDETTLRDRIISLINEEGLVLKATSAPPPESTGITLVAGDFCLYIDGGSNTINTVASEILFTTSGAAAVNKWGQFTTGARHVFGITYFDRAMRPFAVAANASTKIYAPTVVEAYIDGDLLSSTSYEHKNYIDWEIRHEAPAEARYWQWFYAGCNIQDFWFYAINSVTAATTEVSVVISSLQAVQTDFPLSQIGPYEWQRGDRLRVVTKAASMGDYGALADAVVDVEILAFATETSTLTIPTTASNSYDLGAGSLIEIYRPQTSANEDLFFAFGPIYETYIYSANVYHRGSTQDQYGTSVDEGAKGRFDEGDSYLIARAYDTDLVTGASKTDLFLVESKSYSDFYDSDWYEQGKINIRSNIGERELNNIAISNKLIQDTGINGLCTFEWDDTVVLPDKNGKINALVQVGNVLRVIQQRKRTSFYVGMTEFFNQDGTSQLVATDEILGNARELDGDWGTEHPETVVRVGDMVFFWDLHNRAMVQDSENGAVAISDNKMRAFFKSFGDELETAIADGDLYALSCDYHSVLQTLFFFYYTSSSGARMALYHLPSKRWISTMTGLSAIANTIVVEYGYLYNWYAVSSPNNIAASGWHVPTQGEFESLGAYLGCTFSWPNYYDVPNTAGGALKEVGMLHWSIANVGAANSTGFNGRGASYRLQDGSFAPEIGTTGQFWSSSVFYWYAAINNDSANLINAFGLPKYGISVRLIKDTTALSHGQTGVYTGNDGKVYRTICIGTQEWLADNLCETLYRNGSSIPAVTDNAAWAALTTGARCSFDNDEDNAFTTTTTVTTNVGGVIGAENRFFVVSEGNLHLMSDSADRREFVGSTTKEEAFIKVVGNENPLLPKIIDNVGVISNQHTGWTVDTITIPADATTKVDQLSKVFSADWLTREGITRAPVKRNAYTSGVYAYKNYWEGEKMRGRVVEVEFTLPSQTSGKVEVLGFEIGMSSSNV